MWHKLFGPIRRLIKLSGMIFIRARCHSRKKYCLCMPSEQGMARHCFKKEQRFETAGGQEWESPMKGESSGFGLPFPAEVLNWADLSLAGINETALGRAEPKYRSTVDWMVTLGHLTSPGVGLLTCKWSAWYILRRAAVSDKPKVPGRPSRTSCVLSKCHSLSRSPSLR